MFAIYTSACDRLQKWCQIFESKFHGLEPVPYTTYLSSPHWRNPLRSPPVSNNSHLSDARRIPDREGSPVVDQLRAPERSESGQKLDSTSLSLTPWGQGPNDNAQAQIWRTWGTFSIEHRHPVLLEAHRSAPGSSVVRTESLGRCWHGSESILPLWLHIYFPLYAMRPPGTPETSPVVGKLHGTLEAKDLACRRPVPEYMQCRERQALEAARRPD